MRIVMTNIAYRLLAIMVMAFALVACEQGGNGGDNGGNDGSFDEKEPVIINFTNIEVIYNGDDVGEGLSDGWLIKLYTDMEIDDLGNPIGPGSIMQLLLNVKYEEGQTPNVENLLGTYISQSNSGNFDPNTFVWGYMNRIDLPTGFVERPDATFYASIANGSTEMDVDLLNDGKVDIAANGDGTYTIGGSLVGRQHYKRNFEWRGTIDPKSEVKPKTPNSLLTFNLQLTTLTKALVEDRGDYFYLGNESYRELLIFLVEENMEFSWGKPQGSGEVLRIELLVPWDTDVEANGVPAGVYPMLQRNADTSFDKSSIVPFHSVSGLPDCFSYPYWAGSWYVRFADTAWGDNYARIDSGTITVERGDDGSHRFICDLSDCSQPSFKVATDTTISSDRLTIY